jgi:hypothetical protein
MVRLDGNLLDTRVKMLSNTAHRLPGNGSSPDVLIIAGPNPAPLKGQRASVNHVIICGDNYFEKDAWCSPAGIGILTDSGVR